MKIVQTLIGYGLRHLMGEAADKVVEFVVERCRDDSQTLPKAIAAANHRTWQALAVALAGESLWEQFKNYVVADATERAVRGQLEPFLRLTAASLNRHPESFRKACLNDLNRLRRSNAFKTKNLSAADLAQQTAGWQRYASPQGVLDAAWDAVTGVADALAKEYPDLACLLRERAGEGPPLLAALFSFFLRQEIARNRELSAALTFDLVRNLYAEQETAFASMGQALDALDDKLDGLLAQLGRIEAVVVQTQALVLDLQAELQRSQREDVRPLFAEVIARLDRLGMRSGTLRPQHSLSIHSDDEREAVRRLLHFVRQLPVEEQRQVPALLNGLGKLQVSAGDFIEARRTFTDAARGAHVDAARAEIHFNAYRGAVEQRDWEGAFAEVRQAWTLDPARFTAFPAHRYTARSILGAGGFGTAFLCHDEHFDQDVVVKTLHADDMERSIKEVFNEAILLRRLHDPAIIGVLDCEFADPAHKERPFIVMDYFDGISLDRYIEKHGPLPPEQFLAIARQVVSGMTAAHKQGVLHRDLKPDNLLVQREGEQFQVKIIDFGLALRRQLVETSAAQPGTEITVLGRSATGTLAYSAPEQLGRLPGFKPGPYSDVYAFGKTSWFALFRTTEPKRRHLATLPDDLAELLEKCTEYLPTDRHQSFEPLRTPFDGRQPEADVPKEVAALAAPPTTHRVPGFFDRTPAAAPAPLGMEFVEHLYRLFDRTLAMPAECDFFTLCTRMGVTVARGREIAGPLREQWWRDHAHLRNPKPGTIFTNSHAMQFAWIPPGEFLMGSPDDEVDREADETQHEVVLTKGFYLSVFPVSQREWQTVMGHNPSEFKKPDRPVEQVSWADCQEFVKKLRDHDGKPHRLPTEAEWEYACRAGTTTPFHFGDTLTTDQANYDGNGPYHHGTKGIDRQRTTPVHTFPANAWGLHDLHGNVWEWCLDWYGPYEGLPQKNPVRSVKHTKEHRVVRGGSWGCVARYCRSAYRYSSAPGSRFSFIGFRVAFRVD